ncbi:hypothetical protein PV10_02127 [Exophiala mesophila]|uniref:Uncharacterized protein n=1 Tax=Exophiala mesophila TaxID=212818 RepID=A0A0D2A5T3_EXOME|nr:uncharacterized protein PV10_02127 [Exophiala mesophila]KIV94353.1 hypothetical protein PV10_02127 [Exophiala mesophila]
MNNPEFRQTLHNFSHNLETANQTAQENIYTFTQLYIDPCLAGLKSCLYDCTAPCFPNRENNLRRRRGRSGGRAEFNFNFYDAWDDDEDETDDARLAWGNDELDSLLAGRGAQPSRQRAMSYGSRGRRKPTGIQPDPDQDPTIIPGSSYLGFLERLPWQIGSRKLRYKPSAADLQEHPGAHRVRTEESAPLLEENEEVDGKWKKTHGRQRSDTATSRSTTGSRSSRGDLIMSDEEDDAVPLDDEFAVSLSRRITNQGMNDDQGSGKSKAAGGKRPGASRRNTRTPSSKSIKSPNSKTAKGQESPSQRSLVLVSPAPVEDGNPPSTLLDLKQQEEQAEQAEEAAIIQKRQAARRLALERGLESTEQRTEVEDNDQTTGINSISTPTQDPFPDIDTSLDSVLGEPEADPSDRPSIGEREEGEEAP